MKIAYHVTPKENLISIKEKGIEARQPEIDGDLAISLFVSKEQARIQTEKWLRKKYQNKELILISINIDDINLTETFPFELITTDVFVIKPELIVLIENFNE